MSDARICGREILRKFINLYRENECLWNRKSEDYSNHGVRLTAYTKLLQILKEVDQNANVFTVKTKINSLRTCYRHELKKIKNSKESGEKGDNVYRPTLWYFNDLAFLIGDELPDYQVKEEPINRIIDLRACSRTFVKEFINIYKQNECLWNMESNYYKNKFVRMKAYEKLRIKCLEIDKNASIDLVKRKINSMRSIFFANYKKLEQSKQTDSENDLYEPKLFYYDDLKFLLGRNSELSNDNKRKSKSSDSNANEKLSESSQEIKNQNESTQEIKNRSESPQEIKSRSESPQEIKSRSESPQEFNRRSESPQEIKSRSESPQEIKSRSESPQEIDSQSEDAEETKSRSESPAEFKFFETVDVEDYSLQSDDMNEFESDEKKSNNKIKFIRKKQKTRHYNDLEEESDDSFENELRRNFKRKRLNLTNKLQNHHELQNDEDEFNVYAKYIASEMRTISSEDMIFVKKLFSDALFEAKLGNAKCMRIMSRVQLEKR